MFLVRELTDLMPPGYTVLEDEDFLTLLCTYCGEEIIFYCGGATRGSVLAAAEHHSPICDARHGLRE